MARNVKPGITFYRMDTGHITNKKVRLLYNEFDSDGYYIWSSLVDFAYGKWGYFFDTNDAEELELFASDYCKKKLPMVQAVIEGCLRRGLFDQEVYDAFGILTSEMMQEVFIYATADRRKKGSEFEMHPGHMLVKFEPSPVNIRILPGNNSIPPGNNPQTKQDNTKDKTKLLLADKPATIEKTDFKKVITEQQADGSQEAGAKKSAKFTPPTNQEVREYFITKQHRPDTGGSWMPDRCQNEADHFFNFYETNGWKQGKGKPIKSWQAAANLWIINCKKGTFDGNASAGSTSTGYQRMKETLQHGPSIKTINPIDKGINFLYDRYREAPGEVTLQSVESTDYDRLKASGRLAFTQDDVDRIKKMAIEEMAKREIPVTPELQTAYMKKIAVIEFFKQCLAAPEPPAEIFTA